MGNVFICGSGGIQDTTYPDLTNPAGANNIEKGYQAVTSGGDVIDGNANVVRTMGIQVVSYTSTPISIGWTTISSGDSGVVSSYASHMSGVTHSLNVVPGTFIIFQCDQAFTVNADKTFSYSFNSDNVKIIKISSIFEGIRFTVNSAS